VAAAVAAAPFKSKNPLTQAIPVNKAPVAAVAPAPIAVHLAIVLVVLLIKNSWVF
jgi:hypothetical protein